MAVVLAVAVVFMVSLLGGCKPVQEEVRVANPCDTAVHVWLSDVPPPPQKAGGLQDEEISAKIEASSSRLLTHDPDEPIQQVWVTVSGSEFQFVEDELDFSDYLGDPIPTYRLPESACAVGAN